MSDNEMPEDAQLESEQSSEERTTDDSSTPPETPELDSPQADDPLGNDPGENNTEPEDVEAEDVDSIDSDEPAAAETFDLTVRSDDEPADNEMTAGLDSESEEIASEDEQPADEFPKNWYIVKVTSGRETSIKDAIERRVKIEGLEQFFGQVYIPVEKVIEVRKVKETRNGEKVTRERRVTKAKKKFPGYVMAEVHFNDEIQFLFRETVGVGDFVGSGGPGHPPPPMEDIDVRRMLGELGIEDDASNKKKVKVKLDFEKDDKVRIREGAFANMEGEVKEISEPKDTSETPRITVVVPIFGRPVEVVLDYWQVDKV